MFVAKGMTQTAAYTKAGFKGNGSLASVQASRPEVRARINEHIDNEVLLQAKSTELALQRLSITKERVLLGLSQLAFSNIKDYITIDSEGRASIDLSTMTDDQAAAVLSISVDEVHMPAKKNSREKTVRKTTFKLHDKRAPLVDLGKHLGMFNDKVEHSVSQSLADLVIASFKKPSAPSE